jgi:hypothetical protein
MTCVVSIVMKEPLLHQIDKIRGDVPRSKFISRLLEGAIKDQERSNRDSGKMQEGVLD